MVHGVSPISILQLMTSKVMRSFQHNIPNIIIAFHAQAYMHPLSWIWKSGGGMKILHNI